MQKLKTTILNKLNLKIASLKETTFKRGGEQGSRTLSAIKRIICVSNSDASAALYSPFRHENNYSAETKNSQNKNTSNNEDAFVDPFLRNRVPLPDTQLKYNRLKLFVKPSQENKKTRKQENKILSFGYFNLIIVWSLFLGVWLLPKSVNAANINFSLEAWVKPTSSIATKAILVKDTEMRMVTDGSGYLLCQIHNGMAWQTVASSATTALELNKWSQVGCSYDGANLKVFINGALRGTQAMTADAQNTTNKFYAGYDAGGIYGRFNGAMDSIAIYNDVLTEQEFADHYSKGNLYKTEGNNLKFEIGNLKLEADISSWTANSWHMLTAKWDPKGNEIGPIGQISSIYGALFVDGSVAATSTTAFLTASSTPTSFYFAQDSFKNHNWDGAIQGLIFDENLWNENEIASAYNSGNGANSIAESKTNFMLSAASSTDVVSWSHSGNLIADGNMEDGDVAEWTGSASGYVSAEGGSIDESFIYSRALSADEIRKMYQQWWNDKFGAKIRLVADDAAAYLDESLTSGNDYLLSFDYLLGETNINPINFTAAGTAAYIPETNIMSTSLTGLAGAWNFEESSTPAIDVSGNSNSLTWNGSLSSTTGKFGNAINLNGTSQYLNKTDNDTLDLTSQATISAWVYLNTLTNQGSIADKGTNYGFHIDSSRYLTWDNGTEYKDTTAISQTTWTHIAVTNNGTTAKFYINGIYKTSQTAGFNSANASDLRVGYDGTNYFKGYIDSLRIYSRALTADEIYQQYKEGLKYTYSTAFESDLTGANLFKFIQNGATSGDSIVYADNINLAVNLANKGGMESFQGGDPNIPTGWSATTDGLEAGEGAEGTDSYHTGAKSFKMVDGDDGEGIKQTITLTSGNWHTLNIWAKNNNQDVEAVISGGATDTIDLTTADNNWRKFSRTYKANTTNITIQIQGGAADQDGYFDDISVVALGSNVAAVASSNAAFTPNFGSNPGNVSGEQALTITANDNLQFDKRALVAGVNYENFNPNQGSIKTWVKPYWDGSDTHMHVILQNGTTNYHKLYYSAGNLFFDIYDGAMTHRTYKSVSDWLAGNWYQVVAAWSTDNAVAAGEHLMELYVNAGNSGNFYSNATAMSTFWTASAPGNLYIGENSSAANQFNGLLSGLAIYNSPLSSSEILADYNSGFGTLMSPNSNTIFYLPANSADADGMIRWHTKNYRQVTAGEYGLVAGYNFEESSTPSIDESGNSNSLIWNGTAARVSGKYGYATDLDGDSDYLNKTDADSLDLSTAATVEAWVKLDNLAVQHSIADKGTNYGVHIDTSGYLTWDNGTEYKDTTAISATVWTHIAVTNDGITAKYYVNGVYSSSDTAGFAAINASDLRIGYDGTNYFQGLIDSLRIYNRVLSASEIKAHYNLGNLAQDGDIEDGSAAKWTQASEGSELLSNTGLEIAGSGDPDFWGSWTESAGDGALADETSSFHGGARAAKATAGASANTYIKQAIAVTGGKTYKTTFWTRGDGTYSGQYALWDATNNMAITATTTASVTGATYTKITKYFTAPLTCSSAEIYLYCSSTNTGITYFDDISIAEVQVVSAESGTVKDEDGLAGGWNFEEASTPATDVSGNSNSLTWNGTAARAAGRFGYAIQLDGGSDYLNKTDADSLDIATAATIEGWIKLDDLTAQRSLVDKGTNYGVHIDTSGYLVWDNGTEYKDTTAISEATWTHIAVTNDGTTAKYYINGVHSSSDTTGFAAINANDIRIGYDGTNYFQGLIDSLRIYNRALSASEIVAHYSLGRGKHDNYAAKIKLAADDSNSYLDESLTSGQDYLASFWYLLGSDNINSINFTVSGSATVSAEKALTTDSGNWIKHELSFEADQTGNHLFKFIQDGSTSGNSIVYVDDFRVDKNLADKGGFEGTFTDGMPAGWTNTGLTSGEGAEETTIFHSGAKSFKLNAADASEGIYQTVTVESGKYYTFSIWAKNSNADVNAVISGGATDTIDLTNSNSWTKTNRTYKTNTTNLTITLSSGSIDQTGYFDDVSLVEMDNYTGATTATTTTPSTATNSYGAGRWGETSGSILVDGADTLIYPTANNVYADEGTVAFWVKPALDYNKFGENKYLWTVDDGTNHVARIYYNYSDYKFYFEVYDGYNWTNVQAVSSAQNFTRNTWLHISASWNDRKNQVYLYVNGTNDGSDTDYWYGQTLPTDMYFGSNYNNSTNSLNSANMYFDDLRVYDRALSVEDVRRLYGSASDPSASTLSAEIPFTSGGTGINGAGPYSLTGSFTSAFGYYAGKPITEYGLGIFGSDNLQYDRGTQVDDIVYESFDSYQGTIKTWVKPAFDGADATTNVILQNGDANNYVKLYYYSGNIYFDIYSSFTTYRTYKSAADWTAGNWHHIVAVWNNNSAVNTSGNLLDIYVNGSNFGAAHSNDTAGANFWTAFAPSAATFVGQDKDGANQFNGIIGGLTIDNRPWSGDTILTDYNLGSGSSSSVSSETRLALLGPNETTRSTNMVFWPIAESAGNLITDGNMEDGDVAEWTNSANATVSAESSTKIFNAYSAKITISADDSYSYLDESLINGNDYLLSYWYHLGADNANPINFTISGATTINAEQNLASDSGNWLKYETSFEADTGVGGGGNHLFEFIQNGATAGNSIVYIDQADLILNKVDKGGFEGTYASGVATGWTKAGTVTVAESASAHSGSKAQSVTSGDTSNNIYQTISGLTVGNWYTFGIYGNRSSGSGNATVELSGVAAVTHSFSVSSFQSFSKTFQAGSASLTVELYADASNTGIFDDVSLVSLGASTAASVATPSTEANSYAAGKWNGAGGSFMADGGDRLRYSASGVLPNDAGAISIWWKPMWDYNKFDQNVYILNSESASANLIRVFYDKTNYYYTAQLYNGDNWTTAKTNSAEQTFAEDVWQHIVVSYKNDVDATNGSVILYINGVASGAPYASAKWTVQTVPDYFYVGSLFGLSANSNQSDGWIDDIRIYSGQVSAVNINAIYGINPTAPTNATWKRNIIDPIIGE